MGLVLIDGKNDVFLGYVKHRVSPFSSAQKSFVPLACLFISSQ